MQVWKDKDGRWFATDRKGTQHTLRAKHRQTAYPEARALGGEKDPVSEIEDDEGDSNVILSAPKRRSRPKKTAPKPSVVPKEEVAEEVEETTDAPPTLPPVD